MEEVKKIFNKYEPIKSIYENDTEYICIPENKDEPLAVYYDKKMKNYAEVYFYQENTIPDDIDNSELIYGEELDFSNKM